MKNVKNRPHPTPGEPSAEEGLRINKALAQAGVASRRQADAMIAEGRVKINGETVRELGVKVFAGDCLEVDGKPLPAPAPSSAYTYLMLHKPIQVVSTAKDPQGRETVLDLLPQAFRGKRLYPVGRLDYFSEGLILLTDDGELTARLTHPRHHLPKYYEVEVREQVGEDKLELMRAGMALAEGERLAPVEVTVMEDSNRQALMLTLHQGVNRQIRRMCRDLGLTILRLKRTGQGPLRLGELPKGKCRPLRPEEVASLKKAVGLEP